MTEFQKDYWERADLEDRRPPTHPVIERYVMPKIEFIQSAIRIRDDDTLLDVGCGNGHFTYYFDRLCKTTGVDLSSRMLDMNPVTNVRKMDAHHLEFPDSSFDIVFCHAVLHHVENIPRVLSEMARVSRRFVVLIEPNRRNPLVFLFGLAKREERLCLRFSPRYVKRLVEGAGLTTTHSCCFGLLVPNKTPKALLPLLSPFEVKNPLGMVTILVAEKRPHT